MPSHAQLQSHMLKLLLNMLKENCPTNLKLFTSTVMAAVHNSDASGDKQEWLRCPLCKKCFHGNVFSRAILRYIYTCYGLPRLFCIFLLIYHDFPHDFHDFCSAKIINMHSVV